MKPISSALLEDEVFVVSAIFCASIMGLLPIFESDNPSVVRKMIALGLGVGFWPEHSWGPVDPEKTLWQPLVEEGFQRTISIQLTSQGIEKPAARAFRRFLLTQFEHTWQ